MEEENDPEEGMASTPRSTTSNESTSNPDTDRVDTRCSKLRCDAPRPQLFVSKFGLEAFMEKVDVNSESECEHTRGRSSDHRGGRQNFNRFPSCIRSLSD